MQKNCWALTRPVSKGQKTFLRIQFAPIENFIFSSIRALSGDAFGILSTVSPTFGICNQPSECHFVCGQRVDSALFYNLWETTFRAATWWTFGLMRGSLWANSWNKTWTTSVYLQQWNLVQRVWRVLVSAWIIAMFLRTIWKCIVYLQ